MKHLFLKSAAFCLLMMFSLFATAQENGKINLTFSTLTDNGILQTQMIGGASVQIPRSRSIGVLYLRPINNWAELETGIEYSLFNVRRISNPVPPLQPDTTNSTLSLIDLPVGLRANFLNYFFADGGLLLDLDMNSGSYIDSQTGLGVYLGLGVKYDFKFGGSVFINPYAKLHSLLPFSFDSYHSRVLESGVRFGVGWRL